VPRMPAAFAYLGTPDRLQPVDVLAAIVGTVLVYAAFAWFFPALIRPVWWLVLHAADRCRVFHADRLPAAGPALLVCNHASYLDWMIVWVACRRPVKFVLWSGYFHNPILRFFLSYCR